MVRPVVFLKYHEVIGASLSNISIYSILSDDIPFIFTSFDFRTSNVYSGFCSITMASSSVFPSILQLMPYFLNSSFASLIVFPMAFNLSGFVITVIIPLSEKSMSSIPLVILPITVWDGDEVLFSL